MGRQRRARLSHNWQVRFVPQRQPTGEIPKILIEERVNLLRQFDPTTSSVVNVSRSLSFTIVEGIEPRDRQYRFRLTFLM